MNSKFPHKIFLLFHGRFPSEKAASLFAAKTAESFSKEGVEVVLIVPKRLRVVKEDFIKFYDLKVPFKLVRVATLDLFPVPVLNKIAFRTSYFFFALSSLFFLARNARKTDIIYSDAILPTFFASFVFPKTFYELHDFPEHFLGAYRVMFARLWRVLTTNTWKRDRLVADIQFPEEKIIVQMNAVDVEAFRSTLTVAEARAKLDINFSGTVVLYTGHLYSWKGVDTLATAASLLPDCRLYFVGGTAEDVARMKTQYRNPNIVFIGHVPHSSIVVWQSAANVLVLPNTAKEKISMYYTSPMKLFEYMASGKPIVASKLPSIQEIVGDGAVIFAEPDNASVLANSIKKALDPVESLRVAGRALELVANMTWKKRAERIIQYMISEYDK